MVPPIGETPITLNNVRNLTDEEIRLVQLEAERRLTNNLSESEEKSEGSESKEKIEGLPELEGTNFRIDSTNRKEVTDENGVRILENKEGDVREFLEGDHKGEQFFTGDELDGKGNVSKEGSATRETKKAGKKLPPSWTTYRDIIEKKYKGNYQDFLKGENMAIPGWRNPQGEFTYINLGFHLRCADGSSFYGNRSKGDKSRGGKDHGFSVRCLKG